MIPEIIKMRLKNIFIFSGLFCCLSLGGVAQTMEVGLNVGAAGYMGDLNQKNPVDFSGIAFGAYVKRNFDAYWGLGIHYNYGKIKDDDAYSSNANFRERNINFSTPLHELSLQVDFNLLDYFAGGGTKNFTPYIFTGVAGVLFNPKAVYQDQEYELKYYHTENVSYKNYAISIPYGVGIKYRISEKLSLFSQLGYRTAFTDYLDDVGDNYPQTAVYGRVDADHPVLINLSNPSARPELMNPGGQRGDHVKKDTYMFLHIGISYTFLSDKCFTF